MKFAEWRREIEPHLRERAYGWLSAQPESLLETAGGPVGMKADLYLARLIGVDDQIIDDTWLLRRVEPEILTVIPDRLTLVAPEDVVYPTLRTARYVLQSGFATLNIGLSVAWDEAPRNPEVRLLFLRYRKDLMSRPCPCHRKEA